MDLETRLSKLERSNRQLRIVIAGLTLMLLASIFFGSKLVSTIDAAQSGDRLELRELTIKNSNGEPVVVLRGDARRGGNPGIQLMGGNSVFECFDDANRKTISIGVQTGDIAHKGSLTRVR